MQGSVDVVYSFQGRFYPVFPLFKCYSLQIVLSRLLLGAYIVGTFASITAGIAAQG